MLLKTAKIHIKEMKNVKRAKTQITEELYFVNFKLLITLRGHLILVRSNSGA